jgi:glycosyltransferase involved in cell wall biosynthesis
MAHVLWIGTFDPSFARNRKLARLLELGGHRTDVVNRFIWGDRRYEIPTGSKIGLSIRAVGAYVSLAWRLVRAPRPDLVLVTYPGWFDMLVLGGLARARRIPVVFDVFIAVHDTVVSDRRLVPEGSLKARVLLAADRWSMRLASRVIADTPAHADFFAEQSGVARSRVDVVGLGAQDDVFAPMPEVTPEDDLVVFHGTFIGLQGLETIVRAAKQLEPDGIRVRLVGSGQDQTVVDALVEELHPINLEVVGMVPLEEVPRHIASAAVCLGIFGTSEKAGRVVPNKLYECLAVGRPVLTGDTAAIASAFDGEVAVAPVGDPDALAAAIRGLLADPVRRADLARRGRARYLADFEERELARLLDGVIERVTA